MSPNDDDEFDGPTPWSSTCNFWNAFNRKRVGVYTLSLGQHSSPLSIGRIFDVYHPWQAFAAPAHRIQPCLHVGADAAALCNVRTHGGAVVPYLSSPAAFADEFR